MLEQSQASNCPETAQKRFLFRSPEDNLLYLVSPTPNYSNFPSDSPLVPTSILEGSKICPVFFGKSPFVRGARPNGQSNGSYRVRVHVARATESHNVARMPRGAGTSPCDKHLLQADDTPRWHCVHLFFSSLTLGGILSEKWLFPKNG